ncbi:D-alanine--D-alanine ligase [Paenibacillus sp. CAA11]|uniref:D-alanine--D-alanine ligase n=1 Tax=Paenibacillus sp. CAA11 TaxID=1532905 RepID=UPI000D391DDD|nr:D-alanine--D-alanine ligase [Paenibacillus sp. CAA11]AWB44672.1 D-alanine--D-alanine ligase [Paenibacillus sp. CAA11]
MRVGVIMGGNSSEREISLLTGKEMLAHLDTRKYDAIPIEIRDTEELAARDLDIDFVLLALHGSSGEDGTVQAMLESMGIPYSGSSPAASNLCMDKNSSKKLLRSSGIPTPDWLCWRSQNDYSEEAVQQLGYPAFVKPNTGGSSVGALPVTGEESLKAAVQEASRWDTAVLIEQLIEGRELTCSILGREVLPILSIRPQTSGWFDYRAKYEMGGADEQVADLPPAVKIREEEVALATYRVLNCSVYARIDMMLHQGIPYVLEANTLPGLTQTSLMPKSAAAAGISFSELLDRIIELSLQERNKDRKGIIHE